MSPGKVLLLVFGAILVLIGTGLLVGGGALMWTEGTLKDSEGFYTTRAVRLARNSYAIVSEPAEIDLGPTWILDWSRLVTVKVEAASNQPSKGLFIGIAEEAAAYLTGVEYDEITKFHLRGRRADRVEYRNHPGGSPPAAPASQTFWIASAHGLGTQALKWDLEEGSYLLVLMNEDGSSGVDVEASLGVKVPLILGVAIGLLTGGIVVLLGGAFMIFLAVRRPRHPRAAQPGGGSTAGASAEYPATLSIDYSGRDLDRLTTFFRLFAAIPILIVLGLLAGPAFAWEEGPWRHEGPGFAAFVVLPTVLMLVFRRKYPRWWFDWNLALARFAARVAAYLALLTDLYPSADEEQAVHIEIRYPDAEEELNRWLPLVKWFLAIPHYIVLWLLGIAAVVVVIIAWFAILFTGRYPRDLFDFMVGVFRWHLRVLAYAFLLTTDHYPPFSFSE
jgi:hypothetical protein